MWPTAWQAYDLIADLNLAAVDDFAFFNDTNAEAG